MCLGVLMVSRHSTRKLPTCARRQLGAQGCRAMLAVPVSFVSEHIETLEEMDMEYRELVRR